MGLEHIRREFQGSLVAGYCTIQLSAPVPYGGDVEVIVALQLPLEAINEIMQERS